MVLGPQFGQSIENVSVTCGSSISGLQRSERDVRVDGQASLDDLTMKEEHLRSDGTADESFDQGDGFLTRQVRLPPRFFFWSTRKGGHARLPRVRRRGPGHRSPAKSRRHRVPQLAHDHRLQRRRLCHLC